MSVIKTYANWKGDLHEYLQVGDLVDEEIVEHFINVMPPACYRSTCIQMGAAYTHIDNKPVYATLSKTEKGWTYAGHCFRGEVGELA